MAGARANTKAAKKDTGFTPVQIVTTLTPEQQAIHSQVEAERHDFPVITEGDMHRYDLARDPFEFPEPIKELERKREFKFRWSDPKEISNHRYAREPMTWYIVNRVFPGYVPELDRFIDSTGAVRLGQNVLMYKPWNMYVAECKIYESRADAGRRGNKPATIHDKEGADGAYFKDADRDKRAKIGGPDIVSMEIDDEQMMKDKGFILDDSDE